MISILIPSRGRPEQLERLLFSAFSGADDKHNVQAIVRVDEDDKSSVYNPACFSGPAEFVAGKPGVGNGVMINECSSRSFGGIIMICGDDVVFRTPGWDAYVEELMPVDGIGLVFGNDGFQEANLATHPFIGRAAINVWGGKVIPDEYGAEFGDTHIWDIFVRLGRLGHKRIFYAEDLVTEHMHHLNGKAPLDDTYRNKKTSYAEGQRIYEFLADDRQRAAEALARVIEGNA